MTDNNMASTDLTQALVQDYFRQKLGDNGLKVTSLVKFPRGVSRETWFVEFQTGDGKAQKYTLRRNLPIASGSVIVSTLRQEFEIYHRLGETDVPIAKALWYEDDPKWLSGGGEFYIREHIEGHYDIPHFFDESPEYDELRIAISREHMSKLALVHTCDWQGLGLGELFPVPAGVEDCARVAIETIVRDIDSVKLEPIPLVHEAVEWLHENAPVAPRVSFLKGTNGYGEEVFRGREIVALSDWELASIGDPAHDFAHLQDFIPTIERDGKQLWGLPQALDYYESCSGIPIEPAAVQYYGVMRAFGMLAYCSNSARAVEYDPEAQVRFAWNGTDVLNLGKLAVASAIGLMPPLPAKRFDDMR